MSDFHLIFCDPVTKQDEVSIPFTLTGSDTSWQWLDCLYKAIYVDGLIASNNRWVGWETGKDTAQDICNRINRHLQIARKSHPDIFDVEASPNMTTDDFNKMHTYFEIYRGELFEPHPIFTSGTPEFRECIEMLNIDIHLFEQVHNSNKMANFNFPTIDFVPLKATDCCLFELHKKPNTIYLEFNMRGKTLMDYYHDDDDHVGDENIRRFEWVGPDFLLNIDGMTPEQISKKEEDIEKWWDRKQNYLNNLGYYKGDPNNTFGIFPLATADIEIEDIIEPRQYLKGATFW